jgi:drug/metabolite transporter (DMT)-like permease
LVTTRGWLLFAALSVFWGIPYLFIKIAVKSVDPSIVVVTRVGISALVLLPLAWSQGALHALRGRVIAVGALALVQITVPFMLISYGEQHIASSLTSLIVAAEPLVLAMLALRFSRQERVDGLRFVGLITGAVGVAILVGLDTGGDNLRLFGALAVLLATSCYAASALMMRTPTYASLPSLGVVAVECAITAVVLAPAAAVRLPSHVPGIGVIASLVALGVVCTALAELVFFALIAEVGASRGTVFTYVNPVVSVLLGVAFLAEPLTVSIGCGLLLIFAGSYFSTGGRLPRAWHSEAAEPASAE